MEVRDPVFFEGHIDNDSLNIFEYSLEIWLHIHITSNHYF